MSIYSNTVAIASDWAAILTSLVATSGYGKFLYDKRRRRTKLEHYLKTQKPNGKSDKKGQHSILHLVAELGMSENHIYEASFNSVKISRKMRVDDKTGLASDVLFEWVGPIMKRRL